MEDQGGLEKDGETRRQLQGREVKGERLRRKLSSLSSWKLGKLENMYIKTMQIIYLMS